MMTMKSKKNKIFTQAGEVRTSQVLWTSGPGSIVDLPQTSVVVLGLQDWERVGYWANGDYETIEEDRLLTLVRREVGSFVKELRLPPTAKEDVLGPEGYKNTNGIPVALFPRWYRCRKCNLLGSLDEGSVFIVKGESSPTTLRVVHQHCAQNKNKDAPAVPARFLLSCTSGHLSDFPWREYVHGGPTACSKPVRFFEVGSSLQTENLIVKCDCGKTKNMTFAFGKSSDRYLPKCCGFHPHLGLSSPKSKTACNSDVKTIMLGAANSWFPKIISVLALPREFRENNTSPLLDLAKRIYPDLQAFPEEMRRTLLTTPIFQKNYPELSKINLDELLGLIKEYENNPEKFTKEEEKSEQKEDVRLAEWRALTTDKLPFSQDEFEARAGEVPSLFSKYIKSVVLVDRLREVRALVGFTRLESVDPTLAPQDQPTVVSLSSDKTPWIPAVEVRGEGLFIRFNEEALEEWESRPEVIIRENKLREAHERWRQSRNLPSDGFPGARYVLLHAFAHVMIREFSLACGYSGPSIRERIYSGTGEEPMAGVLFYTAASDSDGTLGGLVDLGVRENLEPLLVEGLSQAQWCSADPICCEYDPTSHKEGMPELHLAACHACSYISETSCENGNRYLDRAFLVPTLENNVCAFFNLGEVL